MTNVLLTHQGTFSTTEEFVHTMSIITPATDLAAIANDAMTAFQTAYDELDTALTSTFGGETEWVQVGAAEILDLINGDVSAAMHAQFVAPAPSGSGTTGALQNSMCISLTAGTRPNGTPLRGRFYLPGAGEGAITTGRYNGTSVTAVGSFVENWIAGLIAQGHQPAVWSRVLGALQPVTAARVGDVVDTIRSRRSELAEAYTPITVV